MNWKEIIGIIVASLFTILLMMGIFGHCSDPFHNNKKRKR